LKEAGLDQIHKKSEDKHEYDEGHAIREYNGDDLIQISNQRD